MANGRRLLGGDLHRWPAVSQDTSGGRLLENTTKIGRHRVRYRTNASTALKLIPAFDRMIGIFEDWDTFNAEERCFQGESEKEKQQGRYSAKR